jgi:ABC-2 type transport system ATP-binding protein
LKLVGLADWGSIRVKKYSKGMLQRLGLAQALIHHPKLLILDEPTDGVDPAGRRDIHTILNRLTGKGVTIFVNSHLLGEVQSFCEHVAILRKGKLVVEGKIGDLLTRSGYTVNASAVPAATLSEIRSSGAIVLQSQNGVAIESSTSDHANVIMDKIRAGGGVIESFTPSHDSLEELFLKATAPEDGVTEPVE